MEWNPNVELSSACGCALSAQPHALDSSTFGFHSIENSDSWCFTNCSSNLCVIPKNYKQRKGNVEETEDNLYTRWERDFDLQQLPYLSLFGEYFEMILQYGFVTMFVAAFPLAPLFALINNVCEIRIDAYKFVGESRRALPHRAANIGTWYEILEFVTRLAVLTNCMFIAFTTDLIDRLVYAYNYSETGGMFRFMDFTLSLFNTTDYEDPELQESDDYGFVSMCRYRGYYTPSDSDEEYIHSKAWWRIYLAKLAFVLIFEHLIFGLQSAIQYAVPDIPDEVSLHVQRNRYVSKAAAHRQEAAKRRKKEAKAEAARLEVGSAGSPVSGEFYPPGASSPMPQRGPENIGEYEEVQTPNPSLADYQDFGGSGSLHSEPQEKKKKGFLGFGKKKK